MTEFSRFMRVLAERNFDTIEPHVVKLSDDKQRELRYRTLQRMALVRLLTICLC